MGENIYYRQLGLKYRKPFSARVYDFIAGLALRGLLLYFIYHVVIYMWDFIVNLVYFGFLLCSLPFILIFINVAWKVLLSPMSDIHQSSGG